LFDFRPVPWSNGAARIDSDGAKNIRCGALEA
jgi:hypothetical protein